MKRIFQVTLRTLDVEAAKEFYRDLLGDEPPGIVRLHDKAIARGARPHWMGFLDVGDVDAAAASFFERGAVALGPKWVSPEGLEALYVRDPGGALIALAKPPAAADAEQRAVPEVVFHSLNTPDVARAVKSYAELFGWEFAAPIDLGSAGVFHPFGFGAGAPRAGVFGDTARSAGIHPHWTYHFRVDDLDAAVAKVTAAGGLVLPTVALPNGARIAVCDDPQGAAFALHQLG